MNILEQLKQDEPKETPTLAEELLRLDGIFATSDPERAWLQPLCGAAIASTMLRTGVDVSSQIVTLWSENTPYADPEKDKAYREHISEAIRKHVPVLFALAELAGANVLASPGLICVKLPYTEEPLHIPELLHYTNFLPWVTPAEASNPH